MGDKSSIQWTEATWNPITGCRKVSAGCKLCYAERLSLRLQKMGVAKYEKGFDLAVHKDDFLLPSRWKRPRRIFVNSMSDLFHEDLPFEFVEEIYSAMLKASQHTYQVLTKRPERMEEFFRGRKLPPNIWVGTSIEMRMYLPRIVPLTGVDAAVHFVSFEPLLERIPLEPSDLQHVEWVIVGGESGRGHRPFDSDWARGIRDCCIGSDPRVAFFYKQQGGITHNAGGRLLDGREWNEYPEVDLLSSTPGITVVGGFPFTASPESPSAVIGRERSNLNRPLTP